MSFARRLANEVGPRPAGSTRDELARALVAAEFRAAGWTVDEEPFPLPQGGASANVVAWRGEDDRARIRPGRYVVIGAHLDTVEGSPGANDNASGVGVLVALARELADETLEVPVVLVAFGAEEYQPSQPPRHHVGSEQFAARHAGDVIAALSVDMVANGEVTCICWLRGSPDTLAARLHTLAPQAGFAVRSEGDFSDHGPFAARLLPAAVLWTGKDGVYHTPRDTVDLLEVEDLRRAGDLTLAFLRSLAAADSGGLRRSVQR
ncbi:MAG: M28 family metallopeptidase [Nitriliruptorales bacterium]